MASAVLEVSLTAAGVVRGTAQVERLGDLKLGKQIGFKSVQMGGLKLAVPRPLRSRRKNLGRISIFFFFFFFQDPLKRAVAKKAVELVKDIQAVATSYQARVLARQFGVKTVDLNDVNVIDIAFDGADEVDGQMNVIKGGGTAHTMEKVVNTMAKKTVLLVDQSKVVPQLGLTFPVPVEVLPFAISPVLRSLVDLGGEPEIRVALRKDGPVITDLGNMVVDVRFPGGIKDPAELERHINMIPGVVENGLFIGIVQTVLVATKDAEETLIIDLADYVKNMQSAKEDEEKNSS
ncbi:hypothetical protein R1sor_012276 [Riccia sorocarpa]|uniref:ribose-5-phosphate isomerase n=1 Tax=Riccia sorocarpa TaxID=122646 RepID=A0ABD3I6X9_9MARC